MDEIQKVLYFDGPEEESKRINQILSQAGIPTLILPAHSSAIFSSSEETSKFLTVGKVACEVVHDFNNILTTINLCAEHLIQQLEETKLKESADTILKAAQIGKGLTCHLLEFTRNHPPEPKLIDVNSILADFSKILRRLMGKGILLELELFAETAQVLMDPIHFKQVILNLAVNAKDAMPAGGNLKISTSKKYVPGSGPQTGSHPFGNFISIAVRDTGMGIEPSVQEKIFQPFFSTKGSNGNGLGLSTVFDIIKSNRGSIILESTPGKGTTFIILLPASE